MPWKSEPSCSGVIGRRLPGVFRSPGCLGQVQVFSPSQSSHDFHFNSNTEEAPLSGLGRFSFLRGSSSGFDSDANCYIPHFSCLIYIEIHVASGIGFFSSQLASSYSRWWRGYSDQASDFQTLQPNGSSGTGSARVGRRGPCTLGCLPRVPCRNQCPQRSGKLAILARSPCSMGHQANGESGKYFLNFVQFL